MTSFVHLDYSNQHPGVARFESAIGAVKQAGRGFPGAYGAVAALAFIGASARDTAFALIQRVNALSLAVSSARLEWAHASQPRAGRMY